jgi:hypothetical protein
MKSYYEIADMVYSNAIIATDADDVATMSIESEGNFNQAMVKSVNIMLRGAEVFPLDNKQGCTSAPKLNQKGGLCGDGYPPCCEYK